MGCEPSKSAVVAISDDPNTNTHRDPNWDINKVITDMQLEEFETRSACSTRTGAARSARTSCAR